MMTVGQMAKACDVRNDTVRYYERIGMIPTANRTESGYRKFEESTAERIRFIKNAQSLGFTLEEIKTLLKLNDSDSNDDDCSRVRRFAETKISDIDLQIRQLQQLKRELEKLVRDCPGDGISLAQCSILAKMKTTSNPG